MDKIISRRQISVLLAGGLGTAGAHAQAEAKKSGFIHQEVDFKVAPERIYKALLDAKQFSAFTQTKAEIQTQPGGAFKLFDGQIEGRNVELIPNQRIVQAWRPASWPAGEYSIVRFEFVPRGAETHLVFDHAGFTEDKLEHLKDGWLNHYWEPLHKYPKA
jgi:activator of HSP90 ATPase